MSSEIDQMLASAPIVALVQSQCPDTAVETARALAAGGIRVIEVVLRTADALSCLKAVATHCEETIVGAGTVLSAQQTEQVVAFGARFIVSPGLDDGVVATAQRLGLPVFPGIATASEAQKAWNLCLRTVKFFPASLIGGTEMIRALGSVFGEMRFIPTGGISARNLGDFLALPQVVACGGSWLTPKPLIDAGNFEELTRLAQQALFIAQKVRG